MGTSKKCFVISPIGDEGSDTRSEADALLWVIRTALEKYDFEVIRVDEIARSATITNEIVQLIQECELCFIVLTGENPNVFYEAGRRHETGKPFVQLCRRGERIPFDVAGIKTILYDEVQSLSSAAKLAGEITRFIEEFEKSGYGASGTGVSLSTIASAVDRIEQKVGRLIGGGSALTQARPAGGVSEFVFEINPRQAFQLAVMKGDVSKAAALLPRLEQLLGPSTSLLFNASTLALLGHEPALELVYRMLSEHLEEMAREDASAVKFGVGAIVQFFCVTDRESEGIERCRKLLERAAEALAADKETKAFVLNQMQKLYYGAKKYEDALRVAEEMIALAPTESAYMYNISLIYEKLNLMSKATEMVDRYMSLADMDADHCAHAVEIYVKQQRTGDARTAFSRLRSLDATRANMLLLSEEVREMVG